LLAVIAGGLIIGIAVILSQTGNRVTQPSPGEGSPRVAVDQEVYDYGMVQVDTPIETVFRVSNVGQGTLRITENPKVELVEGC
jgi:hypothetical protein